MASRIQREIRQSRPFRSAGQEAVIGLLRVADELRRQLGAVVESGGVTLQQYNVLRILRGAGRGGLPTLEIAERMVERAPGITRMLDRLEKKGLIVRDRNADDRRQVVCRLTPAARRTLARLDGPVDEADDGFVAALSARDLKHFIRCLETVLGR